MEGLWFRVATWAEEAPANYSCAPSTWNYVPEYIDPPSYFFDPLPKSEPVKAEIDWAGNIFGGVLFFLVAYVSALAMPHHPAIY